MPPAISRAIEMRANGEAAPPVAASTEAVAEALPEALAVGVAVGDPLAEGVAVGVAVVVISGVAVESDVAVEPPLGSSSHAIPSSSASKRYGSPGNKNC
jgi:hypothetical protein